MYCKVAYCRYSSTHVTKGHCCGRCGKFGHGEVECFYPHKIEALKEINDVLPNNKICSIADCNNKFLHTIEGHHCPICRKRAQHSIINCPQNQSSVDDTLYNIKCPMCRTDNTLINPKKIFGLTDKCAICLDNNVEILMPTCYHCCLCLECVKKL